MLRIRELVIGALACADVGVLVLLRPAPARLAQDLAAPQAWLAQVGPDRAVATLAGAGLWLAAAWIGFGFLCAAMSRLPGVAGGISGRACRVVLPRVLWRVIVGSAGLGVFLAPVAAGAESPTVAPPIATAVPAPVWPVDAADPSPASSPASLPAPTWPAGTPATTSGTPTSGQPSRSASSPHPSPTRRTSTPTSTPAPTHPPTSPTHPKSGPSGPGPGRGAPDAGPVRVHAGDSLWLLAAHRLGRDATDAQVAASWPRWYAANRDVIGADPALITPGQVLQAPAPTAQETR
ncbi:MAG: hypothetical protein QOJ37_2966 [Pseudonocardiales bacterium]|nr:hypothetical protein [Pseudonocardiales bacterium]